MDQGRPLGPLVLTVVLGLALAACGGDEVTATGSTTTAPVSTTVSPTSMPSTSMPAPTTVPVATTASTSPTTMPVTTTSAPAQIVLGPTGIGVASYGDPKATAMAAVTALLGPPLSEGPGCEPAGPTFISAQWPGIRVDFLGGEMFSYGVRAPSTFRTQAGIGLGSTVAELQAAYGASAAIPGLPPEFGIDNFAVSFPGTDRQIFGSVTSTGPEGTITAIFTTVCD